MARTPPKRRAGAARRRAPNATHTVVWRTGAPKVMENVTYFEHPEMGRKIGSREGAPNATHSSILLPRAPLEGFVVPPRRRRSVALAPTRPSDVETKMLIFHWKNVQKLTQRKKREPKRTIDMKQNSCRTKNMSKTIGESKILECCMYAKSKIIKIHWGNV